MFWSSVMCSPLVLFILFCDVFVTQLTDVHQDHSFEHVFLLTSSETGLLPFASFHNHPEKFQTANAIENS